MTHQFKLSSGAILLECDHEEFIYLTQLLDESNIWKKVIRDCRVCVLYGVEVDLIKLHSNNYRLSKKIDSCVEQILK